MMKRLFTLLTLIILFCTFISFDSYASNKQRIVDNADLLTSSQEEELSKLIDEVSVNNKFDLVIVTIDSLEGKSAEAYADDYYDYNGYGYSDNYSGALFLISTENKRHISTCGDGLEIYDDYLLDEIQYSCIMYLEINDYYNACKSFIEISNDALEEYYEFPLLMSLIISLVIGFIIAFVIVSAMKNKLKSVRRKLEANVYTKPGSMNITISNDIFLYSHVSKRPKPKNNNSGGSHTSSSGRSHGGRSF